MTNTICSAMTSLRRAAILANRFVTPVVAEGLEASGLDIRWRNERSRYPTQVGLTPDGARECRGRRARPARTRPRATWNRRRDALRPRSRRPGSPVAHRGSPAPVVLPRSMRSISTFVSPPAANATRLAASSASRRASSSSLVSHWRNDTFAADATTRISSPGRFAGSTPPPALGRQGSLAMSLGPDASPASASLEPSGVQRPEEPSCAGRGCTPGRRSRSRGARVGVDAGRPSPPAYDDPALVDRLQQVDAAEERRLARARGADQADDLVLLDLEVDPVENLLLAEGLAHSVELDGSPPTPPFAGDEPVGEARSRNRQGDEEERFARSTACSRSSRPPRSGTAGTPRRDRSARRAPCPSGAR